MTQKIHQVLLDRSEKKYPFVFSVLEANGALHLKKKNAKMFLEYLARTVAGQQLSSKAAATIWGRVKQAADSEALAFEDFFVPQYSEALRVCGLSGNKVKAILGLNKAISSGDIDPKLLSKKNYQNIIDTVTSLWGFGPWSADMTALFFFASPDVWSNGDAALAKAINILSKVEEVSSEEILASMSPYRSYFSMHLWRALDQKLI